MTVPAGRRPSSTLDPQKPKAGTLSYLFVAKPNTFTDLAVKELSKTTREHYSR